MTDLDAVPTFGAKQSLAARLAREIRDRIRNSYETKANARKLAELERVANFDKLITADEIRSRVRAGDWK